jgi:electron transfer flavoprotein beta subunit
MKLLVCVKQVQALDDEIVLRDDGRDVDPGQLEPSLNEWDSFALEEAILLRERHGGEVVAASYGASSSEPVLRRALAMGVDRAVRVEGDPTADPFTVGHGLSLVARHEQPDLVLAGAQSSDSGHGATGSVVAGLLGLPCVAVAKSIDVTPDAGRAQVDRELEGGVTDRLHISLPAVVTVQTGINKPRYANLRAIKLAEQKSIDVVPADGANPAYVVRRMFSPSAEGLAQPLGENPSEAAATIARLIQERA